MKSTKKVLAGFVAIMIIVGLANVANATLLANESFDYPGGSLFGGSGGTGWSLGNWQTQDDEDPLRTSLQVAGSGGSLSYPATPATDLVTAGSKVEESADGGSRRFFLDPTLLDLGTDTDFYMSFLATRLTSDASFQVGLASSDPVSTIRWAVDVASNGDVAIQAGTDSDTSLKTLAQDNAYLVVSKFEAASGGADDIARVSVFNVAGNGDYLTEPTVNTGNAATDWDWGVAGLTGVQLNNLKVLVDSGTVGLDEFRIGTTYADVVGVLGFGADFDVDGDVDGNDLTDSVLGWEARFGVDLDGSDFLTWQREFGSGVGPATAALGAVPEPSTLAMVFASLIGLVAVKRRRF